MNCEEIISRDPDVMGGIPVFAGTRVPNEVLRTIQPGEVAHVTS